MVIPFAFPSPQPFCRGAPGRLSRCCSVLRSGGLPKRAVSDAALGDLITKIHQASGETYDPPRIHAELADAHHLRVGRKCVARLMRVRGLVGVHRRRVVRTTVREPGARPPSDLVERNFSAAEPNALSVADISLLQEHSCVIACLVRRSFGALRAVFPSTLCMDRRPTGDGTGQGRTDGGGPLLASPPGTKLSTKPG